MAIISNQVTLKVFRLDPDVDRKSRYQEYTVEVREGMTVLEALIEIVEHQDATLSFRYSCRSAVCGSCAMTINGYIGLACQTQIKNLGVRNIRIDPLPYMKVLKDLVVDMDLFYQKYERVKPYLIRKEQPPLEHEFIQMLDERHTLGEDNVLMCILCACCYGACPMDWLGDHYLGPAAIVKVQRFMQDSRDQGSDDRLPVLDGEDGVWRCHTVFNCVEACPKDIQLTRSIGKVKNSCTAKGLRP